MATLLSSIINGNLSINGNLNLNNYIITKTCNSSSGLSSAGGGVIPAYNSNGYIFANKFYEKDNLLENKYAPISSSVIGMVYECGNDLKVTIPNISLVVGTVFFIRMNFTLINGKNLTLHIKAGDTGLIYHDYPLYKNGKPISQYTNEAGSSGSALHFGWSSGDILMITLRVINTTTVAEVINYTGTCLYPIGSIFMSLDENIRPALIFGGSWERIKGRFLVGAGKPDANTTTVFGSDPGDINMTLGDCGGEATHKLTVNEMPNHSHDIGSSAAGTAVTIPAWGWKYTATQVGADGGSSYWSATHETGGDQAHNNIPPYLAVYMWKRTE